MKILWASNGPWMATGYGRQTKNITTYLAGEHPRVENRGKTHDVKLLAFQQMGAPMRTGGIDILPIFSDKWGSKAMKHWLPAIKPDAFITLMDVWVRKTMTELGEKYPWYPYVPIDGEPLPPRLNEYLDTADTILPFSDFGEEVLESAGFNNLFKIPHGVDTKTFKPIRRTPHFNLESQDLDDKFIYLMVAMNKGPRKQFPRLFRAFKQVHEEHSDTLLWLHTDPNNPSQGYPLVSIARQIGLNIGEDVIFTPDFKRGVPYNDDKLNQLYNLADVHCLPSMAEGFGLPVIESMSAGLPNVFTDFSTAKELIGDNQRGYRARVSDWWTTKLAHRRALVDVDDFANGMLTYYEDRNLLDKHSENAHKFAKNYDWSKILPKWDRFLKLVEESKVDIEEI